MRKPQSRFYHIFVILSCISLLNLSIPLQYVASQSVSTQSSGTYLPLVASNNSDAVNAPIPTPIPLSRPNQAYSSYLPVVARDGSGSGNPPTQPAESGWVSGIVYDSTTCDQYLTQCKPLAGVRITLAAVDTVKLAQVRAARKAEIAASGYQKILAPSRDIAVTTPISGEVTTDSNGAFNFPVVETGNYWLRGDKTGYTYAQRQVEVTKGRSTATNAIYLTPLDSAVTSCTSDGCMHTNSDDSIELVIMPGAIPAGKSVDVTATNFKRARFLPSGELPEGTWETYAFNLGGASEFIFEPGKTAMLRMKNDKQFAPGTEVPLGYWNQATQAWEHTGTGVVDTSGQWVEITVAHFSNYDINFPVSDPAVSIAADKVDSKNDSSCPTGEGGCFIHYKSGQLDEWLDLPPIELIGGKTAPQLRYGTDRTNPSSVIDVDLKLNGVGAVEIGKHIGWELYIEGKKTDSFTFDADLSSKSEVGRYRYLWDGRNAQGERLPSGIYEYQVKLSVPYKGQYCAAQGGIFGNPPDCTRGATGRFVDAVKDFSINGTVLLDNQAHSPFGAGWILAGLQRLYPQTDGKVLLTNGDGSNSRFVPAIRSSTFDTDAEGWSTVGDAQGGSGQPDYLSSGGNPGGYISATDDAQGSTWYWQAPASFVGNISTAYNGALTFFLKQSDSSSPFDDKDIILKGAGITLSFDTLSNPSTTWTYYSVPLNESAGWQNDNGSVLTKNDLESVLSSLEVLQIRGEYRSGPDTDGIDSVRIEGSGIGSGSTEFISPEGEFSMLTRNADNTYTRRYLDGTEAHFSASGSQNYILAPDGRKTIYTYNADSSIATMGIIAPSESVPHWVWTFNYAGGKLSTISDPAGRTTSVTVDVQNNLVTAILPDNTTRHFAYDGNHLMVQGTDQNNAVTDYTYDKYGRITTLTEPSRPVYNPATATTEIKREVRTFTPSDTGYALINDSPIGDPANPAPRVPLSSELIDSVVYGRGQRSGHTNNWGSWLDQTDGISRTTTYARDAANNITRIIYPNGECITYTYDSSANPLTKTRLPMEACASGNTTQGQTWTYTYESHFNQLKTETDPLGNVTTYIYDYEESQGNAGHLIRIEYPQIKDETGTLITPKETYTYNALGLLESATDQQGIVTKYIYSQGTADEANGGANARFASGVIPVSGLLAQVIEDAGDAAHLNLTTTYKEIDGQGNAQTVIDSRGNLTYFAFDPLGRPLMLTTPLGEVTKYEYDSRGNLLRVITGYTADNTTGRNMVTQFTYDANDQLLSQHTEADNQIQAATMVYDINGKLAVYTNSEGQATTYNYDAADQLTAITDSLGQKTQLAYTQRGQLQSTSLANNTVISFTYDAFGNLNGLIPPGRTAHKFDYTLRNELAAYHPPVLNTSATDSAYIYDALGQLTSYTRPDGKQLAYTYDTLQRLHTLAFSRGQITYAYNPATSQLTGINAPDGINLAFGFDQERLTSTAWSGALNGSVQFTYDATGRTTAIGVNNTVPIAFQYDASYHLTQAGDLAISRLRQSRQVQSTTLGQVNDAWTYDAFGKTTHYQANAGATSLYGVDYTYDKLNRIATKTEIIAGVTATYAYTYDAVGRLVEVRKDGATVESYTYDANGNRLTALGGITGSYDNQDRLLIYGGNSYTYTPNGELLTKTNASGATTYTYDEFGNLTTVNLPSGEKVEYLIDGLDRRIGKKVNGALVQGFLFEEQLRPVAELDGSGNVISRFVYGDHINVPEYMVKGNATYRLVLDQLGNVRLVVDVQTGAVAQRIDYDAFGNVTQDTHSGFQPFGFAGGLYDAKIGLVRFGARDYDSTIGRWLTKDPIGFDSGDTNLYIYVRNNPVNFVDSDGLIVVVLIPYFGELIFATGLAAICAITKCLQPVFNNDSPSRDNSSSNSGSNRGGSSQCPDPDDESGDKTPRGNQRQNDQFRDAVRKIENRLGRRLSDREWDRLHRAVSRQGYGYHDIVELGVNMFGK